MSGTIIIWVRRGRTDHDRIVTFHRPNGISDVDLIEAGFAIDGNVARADVYLSDDTGHYETPLKEVPPQTSLGATLGLVQERILRLLAQHGHRVIRFL